MTLSHSALDSLVSDIPAKPVISPTGAYPSPTKPSRAQYTLADVALSILDHIPIGIIFLESNMCIQQANATARSVLSQRDGLLEQNQRLVASTSNQTVALHNAVKRILGGASRNAGIAPHRSAIKVSRPSARRSFELLATTFPSSNDDGMGREILPVLFIFDPEGKVQPIAEIIMQFYNLTVAETKIAIKLMQGFTLDEIATMLRITKETARKQLQSVFWKTNTNRQSELILLLIRGSANLRL